MSKNPAPRVMFNFMENEVEEDIQDIVTDDDLEELESIDTFPCGMPTHVEREEIKQDNIFDLVEEKNEILKELIEKELPKPKKVKEPKPVKLTKSGKPRKAMTEEQKQRLALGRQRALEVRRAKKIERDEEKARANEEAGLLKKKKQMDFDKLKKEVEDPVPARAPAPAPAPPPQAQMFTKKDLEDAQLGAIISYEKIRKDRKKIKAEKQLIEQQKQEIRNKLSRPAGYGGNNTESNRFYGYY